ncbi:hypothetical protein Tco_0993954, partial [Tanacetum coccineum]
KRKHDSDDDESDDDDEGNDDDEGPSAGSNQGRSTKRRRSDSAASGSAQPPPKDDDQSSKKPRESDASASKQHPALSSTGWRSTDTRDAGADYSMHRSDPESEHSEQSSDDISKQDKGNDSDMEDTDNAHIPKNNVPFVVGESEREYDISAVYGITTWFRRKISIPTNTVSPLIVKPVRTEMRILRHGELVSGHEGNDKEKKQRLHHINREKTTDQKDLSKSRKAMLEEE